MDGVPASAEASFEGHARCTRNGVRYITTWHTLRLYPSFQPLVTTASPHAEKTTHMASCCATSLVQNVDDAADPPATRAPASFSSDMDRLSHEFESANVRASQAIACSKP